MTPHTAASRHRGPLQEVVNTADGRYCPQTGPQAGRRSRGHTIHTATRPMTEPMAEGGEQSTNTVEARYMIAYQWRVAWNSSWKTTSMEIDVALPDWAGACRSPLLPYGAGVLQCPRRRSDPAAVQRAECHVTPVLPMSAHRCALAHNGGCLSAAWQSPCGRPMADE